MNIGQFLVVLWARKITLLLSFSLVLIATSTFSFLSEKVYKATALLIMDAKVTDPLTGAMVPNLLTMPVYFATQVDIISSRRVASKVVDALKFVDNPQARAQFQAATKGHGNIRDWLADLLVAKLDVKPSKDSSVLQLGYSGSDPQFAAVMANAFADAYIQINAELKSEPAKQNSDFFEGENKLLRDRLESAQQKLSAFQRENGLVATDDRLDVEQARLGELSTQLVLAQGQTYDSQSRETQASASAAESTPEIVNNPFIQGLKSELVRRETDIIQLSERLGENHPKYQAAKSDADSLRAKINIEMTKVTASIGNSRRAAEKRAAEVRTALDEQKTKILQLKKVRDQSALLSREVENAQRVYENMMMRFNQTRLEGRSNMAGAALLQPATPPLTPSSPRILRNLLIATLFGTMFGVALAFLREFLDRRVRSASDLAESLQIPVLGTLARSDVASRKGIFFRLRRIWSGGIPSFRGWRHEPV